MSVVSFPSPAKDKYILVCQCGCATFEIEDGGAVVCASCGAFDFEQPNLSWARKTDPAIILDTPEMRYRGNGGIFVEASAKRGAQGADWIVSGTYGEGKEFALRQTWYRSDNVPSEEHAEWLKSAIREGADHLIATVNVSK